MSAGLSLPPDRTRDEDGVLAGLHAAHCTPEFERVQAELGAHTSFREAARVLEALLPVSAANHESVRLRTHAVAAQLEAADRQAAAAEIVATQDGLGQVATADASRPVVMLDGTSVRAVPGHQTRTFEAICGKVEQAEYSPRRFAFVRSVTEQPHLLLRAALLEQRWRESDAVTVISDGDPALPALARTATKVPVEFILDWFTSPCACVMSSRSCSAYKPWSRQTVDRSPARRSTWNVCAPCSEMAAMRTPVEPWVGSWAEHAIVASDSAVEAKGAQARHVLHGAAHLHREQRGRADRLRQAP